MSSSTSTTLYIKGLDDKIRTSEMKRTLYILASEFGPPTHISVCKSARGRGQAWITFVDGQDAIRAMQRIPERSVYGRQITATLANTATNNSGSDARRQQQLYSAGKHGAMQQT